MPQPAAAQLALVPPPLASATSSPVRWSPAAPVTAGAQVVFEVATRVRGWLRALMVSYAGLSVLASFTAASMIRNPSRSL
jgi:hypothetical protein